MTTVTVISSFSRYQQTKEKRDSHATTTQL